MARRVGQTFRYGTAVLVVAIGPAMAQQQIVERNDPPAVARAEGSVTLADQDFGSADPAPLGPNLAGIRLIGPNEDVAANPPAGVSLGAVENAPEAALRAALAPFLSQPLSLSLIRDMQAAVARVWRGAGYPFVSVTAPPQEITGGIVQLRVIEARMGEATVEGVGRGDGGRLVAAMRARRGERIEARRIDEDVRWLNRHGHRRIEAIFAAGDGSGESDLVLKVTEQRRFQVFGGWSNTGSRATGLDRYFVGFAAWVPELNDLTLSYQLTGSGDLLADPDRIALKPGEFPSYLGHAARLTLPTFDRQALEISPSFIASREEPNALVAFETTTFELPVIYRMALSEVLPGAYFGDLYGGVEFKRLKRNTFFAGVPVGQGEAGLFQIVAGWQHVLSDALGRTSIDLRMRANPGGVVAGNDSATWAAFSGGRVTEARYFYGAIDIGRLTQLPYGFTLGNELTATIAGTPLPDTERLQLGGYQAVRGFQIDDGSVDTGLVLRNEIRLPTMALAAFAGMQDAFSPFAFFDIGHGRDFSLNRPMTLAGAGIGFDYDAGGHLSVGFAAGWALTDGAITRRGDLSLHARVLARF